MRRVSILMLLWFCSLTSTAQQSNTWLRYPALSPDGRTIVFSCYGDLYTVPASGGKAKPLVTDASHELMPVWSHDGKQIAFASNRNGNFDIFIVPARGGAASRLTWHSTDEFPNDFCDNDQNVLFGATRIDAPSNRQFPSEALEELYIVPAGGGRSRRVLTTPAQNARQSRDNRFIVYHDNKTRENPWRKHQVSAAARDIWIYDTKSGEHRQLSHFTGEDRNPVFSNNEQDLYYLSERSGNFNVYQLSLSDTSSSKQLTFFKNHPVRFLSIAKDNTICFGYDGKIYIKKKNGEAQFVNITTGPVRELSEKSIPVTEADEMAIAPSGKELTFIFRGEVFAGSIDGKNIKRITNSAGAETGLSFSPDGRKLLYASERDGSWKILEASLVQGTDSFFYSSTQIKETAIIANEKENYQPAWSPDGKEIAYIENRNTLKIYNYASRHSRTLLTSEQLISRRDHDQYFEWSPDSQWLLVQYMEQGAGNEEVGIIHASGRDRLINLTESGFSDTRPRWMMNGKMVLFTSDRQGLHSYDNSATSQTDMYALFPDAQDWRNFNQKQIVKDSLTVKDTLNKIPSKNDPAPASGKWDHVRGNKERLTTAASLLADALVSKDGKMMYYLVKNEKNFDLWQTDLHSKESKLCMRLNLREGQMQWDREQRFIFLLSDRKIIRIDPATRTQQSVEIKTEMTIEPAKERAAMFEHVWRRTAQTFYSGDLHGTNWSALGESYRHYLPGIDNNFDFAEMLNELLGELNVSHTGAGYTSKRRPVDITASLALFYDQQYKGAGVRIEEVIPGGPLEFMINAGDIIESINGDTIDENKDIAFYLNGKTGKKITLRIKSGNHFKEYTVTAISPAEESDLLYRRWVQRNREETEKQTKGEWGYVHLYRMNDAAYRSAYEDILGRYSHCKGIIVDTRFNRGGDLAPELVTFLSGKNLRENTNGQFRVSAEPSFRWTKPSIVLAGEANYSDGHCFVYDYQTLHMGKLIGMPVPGSCTWMTGQSMLDQSLSFSVPTLGVKTVDGRWMENYQTEPDIRVMNEYGTVSKGRDQQLQAAIRESKLATND